MLRPTKHSHPDKTIINVALIILKERKNIKIIQYIDLLDIIKKQVSGGDILFLPALNFLFLLGLIEYFPKNDTIVYTKNDIIKTLF